MTIAQTLLARNAAYAEAHEPRPPLPTLNTIVVTCTDARVDPAHILGLGAGEAVVLRNIGGRITEAVEQDIGILIAMASKAMGEPARPKIVLVHHTQCGAEMLCDDTVAKGLSASSGIAERVLTKLAIADHAKSLRADVDRLASSALVPAGVEVFALRYDQTSGHAEELFSETLAS